MKNKVIEFGYKIPRTIEPKTYKKVVERYEWNKNNANFEKIKKDIQKEIDVYCGNDLKTLISKNIYPQNENKGTYMDTTIYENSTPFEFINALNSEIVLKNENEKNKDVINKDIKQSPNIDTKDNKSSDELGN